MRMVRFGLYLVGVTLLLTGSAIGQAPATTLRVGLVASVSDAGFFVPMERGYFAEQGLAFADMVPAMANKALDGALLIEPFRTQALEQQIGVFIESADKIYPDHQVAVVLYAPHMRREKLDAGRKFMVAYLQGVRDFNDAFIKKQPEKKRQVIDALAKYTPVKDITLYEKMVMPWLDPDGTVSRQSLRFDQEWYAQNGFVSTKVNLSLVVDDRFVLYAVQRLGRYR